MPLRGNSVTEAEPGDHEQQVLGQITSFTGTQRETLPFHRQIFNRNSTVLGWGPLLPEQFVDVSGLLLGSPLGNQPESLY